VRGEGSTVERDRPRGEEEGEQRAREVDQCDDLDVPTPLTVALPQSDGTGPMTPPMGADGIITSTAVRLSLFPRRSDRWGLPFGLAGFDSPARPRSGQCPA